MLTIVINNKIKSFASLGTGKGDRKMRKRAREFILQNGGNIKDLKQYNLDIKNNITVRNI